MKKTNSSIEGKSQYTTFPNAEIIELLESGGREIVKDLNNSRQAKSSPKVKKVRKQLSATLNSGHDLQELKHIQLLTEAIQDVIDLLELTRNDYHSKGLRKIREYAEDLLEKTETN